MLAILGCAVLSGCNRQVDTQDFLRPPAHHDWHTTGRHTTDQQATIDSSWPDGYTVTTDFISVPHGASLHRVRLQRPGANTTVLYWGGNHFVVGDDAAYVAQIFAREWRPNMVFIDYRGYGKSSGTPTLAALETDAQYVLSLEQQRATAEGKKLVLAGYSLGGGIAASLTGTAVDGVVLIAGMTTVRDLVKASMPWYSRLFINVRMAPDLAQLDSTQALAGYRGPLLVIVGNQDVTTPPSMAKRLYEAAATPADQKQLVVVPAADHGDVEEAPQTQAALLAFVRAHRLL